MTPARFHLRWRDGAYYVSEPNIGNMEVVDAASYDALVRELEALCAFSARVGIPIIVAEQGKCLEEGV